MSFAADPAVTYVNQSVIDDVSGGLVTSIPPFKLDPSFSPDLRNMFIDNNAMEQINGEIIAGSTSTLVRIDGIYPYYQEDGTTLFLVTDSSQTLETQDFQTYTFVSSGANTGVLTRCKQIQNKMWCSNGVDPVFTWDHSAKVILDGTKNTPNVPKGKYIEYYLERVWMYNVPSNASEVAFCEVRSTNGVIIAPDNFLAWPADDIRFVGQGDGQIGSAIWQENSQLKLGKERSIYTMFGTDSTSFIPRPTNPHVGVASHDSVVIMDGQSRFVGNDGIYRGEVRHSDHIRAESDAIDRSGVRTVDNLWESLGDFARGQFSGSTATSAGILQPITSMSSPTAIGLLFGAAELSTLNSNTTFFGFARLNFDKSVSSTSIYYLNQLNVRTLGQPTNTEGLRVTIRNFNTNQDHQFIVAPTGASSDPSGHPDGQVFISTAQYPLFQGFDITQGSFAVKIQVFSSTFAAGQNFTFSNLESWGFGLAPATTVQFISDVATNTSITAWGNFDSLRMTNGGAVDFYERTSTSVVNITTQTWKSVIAGSILNEPLANRFIQWAATITSISSYTNVTNIDNVEIVHIEGAGALNRAFATNWKNRYWLFTSTSPDMISSYGLFGGRITNKNPDAFMPMSGMNLRSIAKKGEDILYGGSSSSGTVYRLDFGSNFNGQTINSYYESPDVYFDTLFNQKYLKEYFLVAQQNPGSSFNLGLSIDDSAFTNTNYSLDGTAILNRNIYPEAHGKRFRWRFAHNVYDDPFTLHNFAVRYMPTEIRK